MGQQTNNNNNIDIYWPEKWCRLKWNFFPSATKSIIEFFFSIVKLPLIWLEFVPFPSKHTQLANQMEWTNQICYKMDWWIWIKFISTTILWSIIQQTMTGLLFKVFHHSTDRINHCGQINWTLKLKLECNVCFLRQSIKHSIKLIISKLSAEINDDDDDHNDRRFVDPFFSVFGSLAHFCLSTDCLFYHSFSIQGRSNRTHTHTHCNKEQFSWARNIWHTRTTSWPVRSTDIFSLDHCVCDASQWPKKKSQTKKSGHQAFLLPWIFFYRNNLTWLQILPSKEISTPPLCFVALSWFILFQFWYLKKRRKIGRMNRKKPFFSGW